MIRVTIEGEEKLISLLKKAGKNLVDEIPRRISFDIRNEIVKSPITPSDTGAFRVAHRIRKEGAGKYTIYNPTRVGRWLLAHLIIYGHRTMVTEKQRRYWFYLLRKKYKGSYERKTPGPPGYVPPRPYHSKILLLYLHSGRPATIISDALRRVFG